MSNKDFLFELGLEEIPAGYIAAAIKKLSDYFANQLKDAKLAYKEMIQYSTPRRFAIKIIGLQTEQNDEIIERIGPAKMAAYDTEGNLSKAALGFLRGAGAEAEDLFIKETPKGEKIAVKKEIKGKTAEEILQQIIIDVIPKINFPKSMRWGSGILAFARPIRWLLVLFGDDVLSVEFNGLKAGQISYGNRFQKLNNPVEITSIDNYESCLKSVFVIPNRAVRKQMIEDQLKRVFVRSKNEIVPDLGLLEIVTDLVEYPTAVIADFNEKYLKLPQKVIISTLSQHQKYFAVKDKKGKITNQFVFISNGDANYSDLIKLGNEKVITARLEDADFFYKEDTSNSLESFVDKLDEVTFQEQLGSLKDKTNRIVKSVEYITKILDSSREITADAKRGALLCKADLVTLMLGEKEFTKLQGYMGMEYARKSGENETVARTIYEHYLPRGERDGLPSSEAGAIVAIADKLDTVCGIIGVDMVPTGSKDPFALRRAANGIVQIIDSFSFEFDLFKLIDSVFENLRSKLSKPDNNKDVVYDFFRQRANWLLKQKEIEYDVIDSVTHIDPTNIPDLIHRAKALQNFKKQEDFIKLVLGFKRVSNIIAEVKETSPVKMDLLQEEMEQILYANYLKLKINIEKLLPEKNYQEILSLLVEFGGTIDKFFDDVLVNVDELQIKQNRYNILANIRKLFLQVADLSKLVVDNENNNN
ncbi:MAG: glycine--tRNA ligase subunit beta [Candidatus Cloacimonadota bacterium]|nr:MAG: glycine--tRNA ligase subunit beta [Candidatus Cloacimonadota bacterium]